jgi:hypothetical protein
LVRVSDTVQRLMGHRAISWGLEMVVEVLSLGRLLLVVLHLLVDQGRSSIFA